MPFLSLKKFSWPFSVGWRRAFFSIKLSHCATFSKDLHKMNYSFSWFLRSTSLFTVHPCRQNSLRGFFVPITCWKAICLGLTQLQTKQLQLHFLCYVLQMILDWFDSWSYETLQMPQWSVGILWRIETCFLLSLCSKCKQGTLGVVSKQIYIAIFVHFKYWFCRQHCFNGANLWSWVHANLP